MLALDAPIDPLSLDSSDWVVFRVYFRKSFSWTFKLYWTWQTSLDPKAAWVKSWALALRVLAPRALEFAPDPKELAPRAFAFDPRALALDGFVPSKEAKKAWSNEANPSLMMFWSAGLALSWEEAPDKFAGAPCKTKFDAWSVPLFT